MRLAIAGIEAELRERLGELSVCGASSSRPSGSGCAPSTTSRCSPRPGCAAGSRTTAGISTAGHPARRPSPFSTSSRRTTWSSSTRATSRCHSYDGQYAGDRSRKETLVDHGFRLPSAMDNRPLRFEEFIERTGQTIMLSATPGPWELEHSANVVEQVIRPTGLVDPEVDVRPTTGQIDDLRVRIDATVAAGGRVLVTTLTKKMAEDLTDYLAEQGVRVQYLHSDVDTIARIELLRELRLGHLRRPGRDQPAPRGLDLPEVALVAILDADKEGFLRSTSSLIQTMGRAARNVNGRVVMYADTVTDSMTDAIGETQRRRARQIAYNEAHGIDPKTITKSVTDILERVRGDIGPPTTARAAALAPGPAGDVGVPLRWTRPRSPPSSPARSVPMPTSSLHSSTSSTARCARRPPSSASKRPRCSATRSPNSAGWCCATRWTGPWSRWMPRCPSGRTEPALEAGATSGHRYPRPDGRPTGHPRRARAQPAGRLARPAPRPADRLHRPVRFGQVLSGLRHHLRRGPAALRRVPLGLRPPVPRPDGQARRRLHRGTLAGDLHRPEVGVPQPALDGRHGHRGLRLPAAPLRPDRPPPLPDLRSPGSPAEPPADRRPDPRDGRGHPLPRARPGGAGPQGGVRRAPRRPCQAGLRPGAGRRSDARADRPGHPRSRPLRAAHHRGGGRPSHRARRHPAAADRVARDRAGASPRGSPRSWWSNPTGPSRRRSPSASTWPAPTAGSASRTSHRATSRSTRPTVPARSAPGSGPSSRSIPSWWCPTPPSRSPRARSPRGPGRAASTSRGCSTRWPSSAASRWTRRGRSCARRTRSSSSTGRAPSRSTCGTGTATGAQRSFHALYEGVVPWLQRRHTEAESDFLRDNLEGYHPRGPVPRVRRGPAASRSRWRSRSAATRSSSSARSRSPARWT